MRDRREWSGQVVILQSNDSSCIVSLHIRAAFWRLFVVNTNPHSGLPTAVDSDRSVWHIRMVVLPESSTLCKRIGLGRHTSDTRFVMLTFSTHQSEVSLVLGCICILTLFPLQMGSFLSISISGSYVQTLLCAFPEIRHSPVFWWCRNWYYQLFSSLFTSTLSACSV